MYSQLHLPQVDQGKNILKMIKAILIAKSLNTCQGDISGFLFLFQYFFFKKVLLRHYGVLNAELEKQ